MPNGRNNTTMATGRSEIMTAPVAAHDSNTERVREFAAKMFEARSIGRIADAIIDIATSGAWRDYDIDGHHSQWLAAEFDYFLITCGVKYDDMVEAFKGYFSAALLVAMLDPTFLAPEDLTQQSRIASLLQAGDRCLRNPGWAISHPLLRSGH